MSIRAIYEDGVLKPLERLPIKEGTEVSVDVYPVEEPKRKGSKRKSVKDFAAYGIWKKRTQFKARMGLVDIIQAVLEKRASFFHCLCGKILCLFLFGSLSLL